MLFWLAIYVLLALLGRPEQHAANDVVSEAAVVGGTLEVTGRDGVRKLSGQPHA